MLFSSQAGGTPHSSGLPIAEPRRPGVLGGGGTVLKRSRTSILSGLGSLLLLAALPADASRPQLEGATPGALFTDILAPLNPVYGGSADWGDFDGDDDLDLFVTGVRGNGAFATLYRNDGGGAFAPMAAYFYPALGPMAHWGDYDNDGDVDLVHTGVGQGYIHNNSGGGTFDASIPIGGVSDGEVGWADWDNDGDLDLAFTGEYRPGRPLTVVTRNTDGMFLSSTEPFVQLMNSSLAWGDFDNDGDHDLANAGLSSPGAGRRTEIYRNDGGVFSETDIELSVVTEPSMAWGDYDADGDLDLLVSGLCWIGTPCTKLYRNAGGGIFTTDGVPTFTGMFQGSLVWGDYDNDGLLDVLSTGYLVYGPPDDPQSTSELFHNNGDNSFTSMGAVTVPMFASSVAWGDYDNDGDLDLVAIGADGTSAFSKIYRNESATPNTRPAAPTGLTAVRVVGGSIFQWDASTDAETPSPGLTYNLRVGTTPGGSEVMSAMASPNGYRRVARMGNTHHNLSWKLSIPEGTYYWSVQAIDAAFAGSEFATEQIHVATASVPGFHESTAAVRFRAIRPNPFSGRTSIEFELPRSGNVALRIHDVGGRLVRTLVASSHWPAGRHQLPWDGLTDESHLVPSGVYVASIEMDGSRDQRRVVQLR
jgi:hypothetical protein